MANRDIYKTNTNTSVKGLVVFSWPRRYIILHRANTGSVWAPLINLSSPQERFTNTNIKISQDKRNEHSLWLSASHEFVLTPRDNKTCRKIGGFLPTKGMWRQVPS